MIAVSIQLGPRQTWAGNDAWAAAIVVAWAVAIVVKCSAIGQNGLIESALWLLLPPKAFAEGDVVASRV